ncbi:multicomponent Na+:H+ antiporter subunit G [Arcanobacterium wilhelmae]|uniref:Multicomponent Na+:H+ antiporter subunit G n=1 Tax=Arcanobacterium wilhelmae TaxID=1803177 RepID=A0ABT9NAL2_9ACTO|nr:monovalent cation/H(+) antiporter subunit G [Arcanobacterium wilhelmae]MDP9800726.1 multicomponent Na+:H+ antiporter subunit G [Arcanobacterium wilhelmae]WFN90125.1 monovalent cation/H(+) antiporter subunit G [Arcanobacterium wilhelmae]
MMETVMDVVGVGAITLGAVLTLIAALGMWRYGDLLARQHVATKPQVLSLLLYFVGIALVVRSPQITWTMLLVIVFQLVTAPISAHLLARAAYRTGRVDREAYAIDELAEDLESTERQ